MRVTINGEASTSLTILSDNTAASPLQEEHGFSVLLEINSKFVLFDTGRGAIFSNAPLLGVDLSRVESIVLSHGHYDHTDALSSVLAVTPNASVYASNSVFNDHYSMSTGTSRTIGLSNENRENLNSLPTDQLHLFSGTIQFVDPVYLSETIFRAHPLEIPSPLLFADLDSTIPDTMPDELVLWFNTEKGLVILTGCCHAGVINTCEHVKKELPGVPLYALIGGFHLSGVSELRLESTATYIESQNISVVVPCHCTGKKETVWLKNRLGSRVKSGFCGMTLKLPLSSVQI